VSKCPKRSDWRAQCCYDGQAHYIATFGTELEAAHATNARCVKVGIPLKNPDLKNTSTKLQENTIVKCFFFLFSFRFKSLFMR
jgi:hypothetical protein